MIAATITDLPLRGLRLIHRNQIADSRGYFFRLFCAQELAEVGWHKSIAQVNHTYTAKCGTIRGMHYQIPPYAEMKLVSCIHGEVFDVAIDLRANSSTYLQSHKQILSAANCSALLIPEGFAHGFQTLSNDCELIYMHTARYNSQAEAGLRFNDPLLAISWPAPITTISVRDESHPLLTNSFKGIKLS